MSVPLRCNYIFVMLRGFSVLRKQETGKSCWGILRSAFTFDTMQLVMKRILLILLLAILPLQASWGVVSTYCQQEEQGCIGVGCYNNEQGSPIHFIEGQEPITQFSTSVDQFDHSCHTQVSEVTSSVHGVVSPSSSRLTFFSHKPQFSVPTLTERPERPQWPSLA